MAFVSLFYFLLSLCGLLQVSLSVKKCDIKEHFTCSKLILNIKLEDACPKLQTSLSCLGELITSCGFLCEEKEDYPYCSMLDGSMHSPMSSAKSHTSTCRTHTRMKLCQDKECGKNGQKFIYPSRNHMITQDADNSCAVKAIMKCLNPIKEVTEVNMKTCVDVARAKNCFLDSVDLCGGSDVEQHAVDVNIMGLVRHIEECKSRGFGFTTQGDICVPNPVDVFYLDNSGLQSQEVSKEACHQVNSLDQRLSEYRQKCNVTSWNQQVLNDVQNQITRPLVDCLKAGYTDNGNIGNIVQYSNVLQMVPGLVLFILTFIFQG